MPSRSRRWQACLRAHRRWRQTVRRAAERSGAASCSCCVRNAPTARGPATEARATWTRPRPYCRPCSRPACCPASRLSPPPQTGWPAASIFMPTGHLSTAASRRAGSSEIRLRLHSGTCPSISSAPTRWSVTGFAEARSGRIVSGFPWLQGERMFFTYLSRELRRRARQASIIALGLALGIGLVITVTALSSGVKNAQGEVLHSLYGLNTDITVTKAPAQGSFGGGPGGFFRVGTGSGTQPKAGQKVTIDNLTSAGHGTLPATDVSSVAKLSQGAAAAGRLTLTGLKDSITVPSFSGGAGGGGGFRGGGPPGPPPPPPPGTGGGGGGA